MYAGSGSGLGSGLGEACLAYAGERVTCSCRMDWWMDWMKRGAGTNPPATDKVHLDYYQVIHTNQGEGDDEG